MLEAEDGLAAGLSQQLICNDLALFIVAELLCLGEDVVEASLSQH